MHREFIASLKPGETKDVSFEWVAKKGVKSIIVYAMS
jgi:hypothetical protein